MGVFGLFGLGNKNSGSGSTATDVEVKKEAAEEKTIKDKYIDMFKRYDTSYAVSRRTIGFSKTDSKRQEFLVKIMDSLPNFAHRDLVEYVLNSADHFGTTTKMFEEMEQCLKQPTSTNLKRFDAARDRNKNAIDTNFILAGRVSRFLLRNDDFMKVLYNASGRSNFALTLFEWYYNLSQLEVEYFKHICSLRDKVAAREAVHAANVFHTKN